MANNVLLYNAALSGYLAGSLAGQGPGGIVAGDYAAIVVEATTWAAAVDAAIPNDNATVNPATPISVITTGVAIAPTTGAIIAAQIGKTSILSQLAYGAALSRYSADPAIPPSPGQIASVVAQYNATAPGVIVA